MQFVIDDVPISWIRNNVVSYFIESGFFQKEGDILTFLPVYDDFQSRTDALTQFAKKALSDGVTNRFMSEPYAVRPLLKAPPLCLADRGIASLMGLLSMGQHLNGYVCTDKGIKMWIARRSFDKGNYAGKLDHLVAGGLPYGIDLDENLYKECYEEAGITRQLAQCAKNVGVVSYQYEYLRGGHRDILYCYDLELPADFTPVCTDGEVEAFYLMDIEEVADMVQKSDEFKPNCNLVIIDFLVRHGYLTTENEDYIEIVQGLR